ncbi:MAG: RsmD family RNA methyltransferase [Candidatus Eremiobacteraeota bacterium]|nr:RsmD family RNA methyltransferase [Candidatus Eremiobacteraeota bacterium]MCW5869137.1 RsmD family RNA methyltransferase [Candidatus Eremiobacteraeota bacterium]
MLGKVRPTTGKVLESILATLGDYWEGARVLDLFAGSGTLAEAALRQGAGEVVAIEGHARVAAALRKKMPVIVGILPGALNRLSGHFDIILGDPPYGAAEGPATLALLSPLLKPEGWIVWEHHHKDPYPDPVPGLSLWRCRRFGETAVSYYRQGGMVPD